MGRSKSDKVDSKSKSEGKNRLEASLYFLEWTKSALQAHSRTINELYLKKLVEHCTKSKIDDSNASNCDEAEQLAKGPKVQDKSARHSIVERLNEAAARTTAWEGNGNGTRQKGRMVSLAEMAAMYRLKRLVQMCGSLITIIERTAKWMDENMKMLKKHAISLNVFDYVETMFEATCSVAEIFVLTAVKRDDCKTKFKDRIRKLESSDYKGTESKELSITDAEDYIPPVEAKSNHFRTVVFLIGSSLVSTIQTFLRFIAQEQVDIRVREVNEILTLLPPMYLRVNDMPLSKFVTKLLDEPPPNKRSFPLAPSDGPGGDMTRSGKSVQAKKSRNSHSQKSGHSSGTKSRATKQKYKNPIDHSKSASSKDHRKSVKSNRDAPKSDHSKKAHTPSEKSKKNNSTKKGAMTPSAKSEKRNRSFRKNKSSDKRSSQKSVSEKK